MRVYFLNGPNANLYGHTSKDVYGAETFEQSLSAVRHGGTVFTIGFLSGTELRLDLMTVIERQLRVVGCNTGSAADLREAAAAIAAAHLTPALDQVYPADRLAQAYQRLAAGRSHFGKLAVTVDLAG